MQLVPIKVKLGGRMTYAEAKEIALLRLELRACVEAGDRPGALAALARLHHFAAAANDRELAAEARRWQTKLVA
nr:hypothetical protein [Kofleriaceae bacterium]